MILIHPCDKRCIKLIAEGKFEIINAINLRVLREMSVICEILRYLINKELIGTRKCCAKTLIQYVDNE